MDDFLQFFNKKAHNFPMHLEIYYSKIMDWCITIYKQGCANDYPNSPRNGDDALIVQEQDWDMELCFAKAHVALKKWLVDNTNGY